MERGSDKHGPIKDDEMEKEMEEHLRRGHSQRADEALDPEPPADDDPETVVRPEPSAEG
ncbi:hypothetical protein [Saccharopolyspora rhizosphaerae]|uniref:hypothetical protein n=1 Tax=Saccharopolyspora rhizosphaerae TaxID=2492662 RepID=UPI0018F47C3D|nr:hypothetical protein [Saccharopolyspora rhizosphaerae]